MTPDQLLSHIADQEKVALAESALVNAIVRATKSPVDPAEFERNLAILKDAGDICRWTLKGKPTVTLSSVAAYRRRLTLNASSTRWVAHGIEELPDRNKARVTEDGRRIMSESDLADEPIGELDELVDKRTEPEDDPDFGRSRILAEENRLGLIRPTLPLVGCQPWTAANWERAPDAHVCDPLDDPRRIVDPADPGEPTTGRRKRRMTPDQHRAVKPKVEDCPVCNGRPLRAMIGLVSRKAGKNRAARPPELVNGGEYCCRCSRSFQDGIWPRVFKITDVDGNGKVVE